MNKRQKVIRIGLGLLSTLLLTALPAQAAITAFLDSPSAGPQAGDDLVSGWAFAVVDEAPVGVTVRVRIDGVTQNEMLCCSPRTDVQAANPGAPLETGFAGLLPYRELAVGPHTIGVEITATGCSPVVIERSVQVVKPGGRSFIQTMDFSQTNFTPSTHDFSAVDVKLSTATQTQTDDLAVTFSTASQALRITGPLVTSPRVFVANLNGAQEVQPVDTTASGTALFQVTNDGASLFYRVEVEALSSPLLLAGNASRTAAAHIHLAPAGANGDIVFSLSPDLPDGPPFLWQGSLSLIGQPEARDALFAAELYVNVHTEAHPGGEIRGQIVANARNCQDPSLPVFSPAGPLPNIVPPVGAGPGQGTATGGCRVFSGLGPIECAPAWQISPAGFPTPCVWIAETSECVGCGPNNENAGLCTNTCR
jgi:hypothetical protein